MDRQRTLLMVAVLAGMLVLLAACGEASSEGSQVIHVEDGVAETQVAQTEVAQTNPVALQDATPTPLPTAEPYVIPTLSPDVDPATPIARVGAEEITLGEFQEMVRFERWYRLHQILELVERRGVEQVLDLSLPGNQYVAAIFATLADSYSFGGQVQRVMTIDKIVEQEALRRGMEVDPFQFDARLAQYLGLQVGPGGSLPPEFDAEYDDFLAEMEMFSGMTEEDFRRMVRARVLYSQLKFLIGQEPEAIPSYDEARVGMEVQDIVVNTRPEAEQVAERLQEGEALRLIAADLGYEPTAAGDASRVLRWTEAQTLGEDVIQAVATAEPGTVVGPIATDLGWWVGIVLEPVIDQLAPTDIDALREQHFLNWIEERMDDPDYVEDYDNWFEHVPQEPLPRDVSPVLVEENVVIPQEWGDDPFGTGDAAGDPPVSE